MKEKILSSHGSGGKMMNEMIEKIIRTDLGSNIQVDDSAILNIENSRIAFTTDSYTITPIFFPGGDIGRIAVSGTVNDLSVMGAIPLFISCSLILEEGFEIETMRRILSSMKAEADYAGIKIVTGDTKVVPQNKGDKIYINTAGIGVFEQEVQRRQIETGDKIIINGTIGDHGIAIMSVRNNLSFSKGLESDCASLNHLIHQIISAFPDSIKFMRDPTRGGVASVLNEVTKKQPFGASLYATKELPIKDEVIAVSNMLGIDPLYSANEGKVLLIVKNDHAEKIISVMKKSKEGIDSCIIGEIINEYPGKVCIDTEVGSRRILPLLAEEQLPRIC